ncbi:MAG TPA: hypothetical protein DCP90_05840 [Clostridiales bacterium]|nr:MAG: hypothetical protein A2Y22_04835 [Clostridiales bacterium GWD2_32_59]HAN10115.1 hypothetical protein [Clostridiales bacterium]
MSRRRLAKNTLLKLILRTDLLGVFNIRDIIQEVQNVLGDNYKYNERPVTEIEYKVEDLQPLETEDLLTNKIRNQYNNYEFILNEEKNIKFVLNEYSIVFEMDNFSEYKEIDQYISDYIKIFSVVSTAYPKIRVVRLGLRKINMIIANSIESAYEIVKENHFPKVVDYFDNVDVNSFKEVKTDKLDNIQFEDVSFNIKKIMQLGIYNDNQKAYQIFIDIDTFKREDQIGSIGDLNEKIININEKIFGIYEKIVTEDFMRYLEDKNNTDFNEKILEGVNLNADVNNE